MSGQPAVTDGVMADLNCTINNNYTDNIDNI